MKVSENIQAQDESLGPAPCNRGRYPTEQIDEGSPFRVLVLNASHEMAHQITGQLRKKLPSCIIMYAPSIELAAWIIRRHRINLIVSSPVLPDGNAMARLTPMLEGMKVPPDIMIFGQVNAPDEMVLSGSRYELAAFRRIGQAPQGADLDVHEEKLLTAISTLGEDIRNDLNNPLQEIVAMVYVAQSMASGRTEGTPETQEALYAIDSAAKNMARVVKGLEQKIRRAVQTPSVPEY